jgi:hypothetical protein
VALWIKEYAHALRVLGGVFFVAALCAGVLWVFGADIEPVAFVLGLISSIFLASPSIAQYLVPDRKPVKDMTYDEILAFIVTTDPRRDWTGISRSWSSEMFLKEDPRLRFRAKYTGDGVQNENFVDKWANRHPDPSATGYWYDLYFDGNLIERFILVSVDGGRANLPPPDIKSGLIEPLDYRVAQIHDILGTLDEYITRSGLQRAA